MESGVDRPQRRKRRPRAAPGADRTRAGAGEGPGPDASAADPPAAGGHAEVQGPELSRTERRNEEARSALAPLAPGEWPRPLLAAIALAGLLGAGNLIAYAAGARIAGHHPGAGVLAFTAVMAILAGGMCARRYLAVLAFEALLAVTVIFFSLFLVEASNLEGVLLCVGVIAGGGWLFWKLVRVMGRLSAPRQSSS
jgi:hypothetical protein